VRDASRPAAHDRLRDRLHRHDDLAELLVGLVTDLATLRGRLETTDTMLRAAESRAMTAEGRLATVAVEYQNRAPQRGEDDSAEAK